MKYLEALEIAESLEINPAWFKNPSSLYFAIELTLEEKNRAKQKKQKKEKAEITPEEKPKPQKKHGIVLNKRRY